MRSYEKSEDGGPLSLSEDMHNFQWNNVGPENSGWHKETSESGETSYYYINVEGVISDTLEIRRIQNIVQAEIPNLYGIGINLNLETGILKLLGRDSVELSSLQLPLGANMNSIEHDDDLGTVTFKFGNTEDIVLDLREIIGTSGYYTREEIDEMFKITTSVYDDENVVFTIEHNTDTSFTNLKTATFTIPSDVEHGYQAAIAFRTYEDTPIINFVYENDTNMTLRFAYKNAFIDYTQEIWKPKYQYDLLILCNGLDIIVYIQELYLDE